MAFSSDKPAKLSGIIRAETPYGKGALNLFFLHIYDAELWSDADPVQYKNPLALDITYHMSISADTLADKTIEQMEHVHSLNDAEKKEYYSIFTLAFCDVAEGDHITAIYVPAEGTSFYCKGQLRTKVTSPGFSHEFFDIWLSEKTSEPDLRKQLLGLAP